METDSNMNSNNNGSRHWRQVVDRKLKRLHSLIFGAEVCLENGDAQTALCLGLRLSGFLESECRDTTDNLYITPIQRDLHSKMHVARQMLAADGDRRAFEQARCKEDSIFFKRGKVDVEMIKQSRFYEPLIDKNSVPKNNDLGSNMPQRSLLQQPKRMDSHRSENSSKIPKHLMQAKLTSLYGIEHSKSADTSLRKQASSPQSSSFHELAQKRTMLSNCANSQRNMNSTSPIIVDDEDSAYENNIRKKATAFRGA